MSHAHTKLIPGKNIALSPIGYWPKPESRFKFKQWLIRLSLKTLVAIILLGLCNLVETARWQTAKEVAETAETTIIEEGIHQAFPLGPI